MDKIEATRKEVVELHQFFQDWATGELPNADVAFARLTSVLDDGFALVAPNGRIHAREGLVDAVRERHGAERGRGYRIRVEDVRPRLLEGGPVHLVVYEEWQETERDGGGNGRLSTAVLVEREGTPNGVAWMHVHETWLE